MHSSLLLVSPSLDTPTKLQICQGGQAEIFKAKLIINLKILKSFLVMILVYGSACLDMIAEMLSETH